MMEPGMTKALLVLAVALAIGGCATTSQVVSNNSVAQKFAAFDRSGWSVTGGQPAAPVQNGVYPAGTYPTTTTFNPFARFNTSTNFQTAQPAGAANGVYPNQPTSGVPLLGGFVLPQFVNSPNVVGQPGTTPSVTPR
jgi:hypothetical protein